MPNTVDKFENLSLAEFVVAALQRFPAIEKLKISKRVAAARETIKSMKNFLDDAKLYDAFDDESPLGVLYYALNALCKEEDVLVDDDVLACMSTVKEFLINFDFDSIEEENDDVLDNLSPNLSQILNKPSKEQRRENIDWVAPKQHGLSNSAPIVRNMFRDMSTQQFMSTAKATVRDLSERNISTKPSESSRQEALIALQAIQAYVAEVIKSRKLSNNSVMNTLQSALEDIVATDNEDDDENFAVRPDNVFEYIDSLHDFLEAVEEDAFLEDEEDYEVSPNMSANLLQIFGKQPGDNATAAATVTDWKPPRTYGLNNHLPSSNTNLSQSSAGGNANTDLPETRTRAVRRFSSDRGTTLTSDSKSSSSNSITTGRLAGDKYSAESKSQSKTNQQRKGEEEDDEEEEEDDDDDDDDDDSDDSDDDDEDEDEQKDTFDEDDDAFYDRLMKSSGMSASLRKSLGLTNYDYKEVQTDWKPPTHSGVSNSKRLF